ncbi:MAK10-like protein [Tanacetum coccineum]
METKDTFSSCSNSNEQDMQQMLKRAKILKGSCLNGLSALKSNFTRKLEQGITKSEFERAFSHIFGEDVDTFTRTFSQNMDTLEQQLTKETILESNSQNAFRVLKTQFEKIFTSVLIKPSSLDGTYARKYFHVYTGMEPQLFKETILKNFDFIEYYMLKTIIHAQTIQKRLDDKKLQIQECIVQEVKASDAISEDKAQERCMIPEFRDTLMQHMESVKKSIDERAQHKRKYDTRVNERQMQTIAEKVDTSKALDASLVDTENIRPIYDEQPMAEVQTTAEINVFATGQQHTEQPKFNNEGESIFSSCYLFRNSFSSTTVGDENPICTLEDYSKPIHEGYRNTIELLVGNNVVPLRSDTIRLVQNGCSFHGLRSEDPNQHLKDFLKLVDSLNPNGENRKRTRLRLFQFSLRNQASNWLECLPAGSISTWEDLTTRFLAQFFPLGRTCEIDRAAGGELRNKNTGESWEIIENLALYDYEGWDETNEFVKPVKAISTPQGIPKTPDWRLLELEDQINFLLKGS